MPLPLPDLDDRDFNQLIAEATQRIRQSNAAWDDLSPGDPGIVLLEVFAYLTDTMIYRLNRLPIKVYIALLRLLGVSLHPPSAARVMLRFSRAQGAGDQAVEIPRGTRVTLDRASGKATPPVFMTTQTVTLDAGAEFVEVLALNADQIDAEALDKASGLPGFSVKVGHAPIIYSTGDPLDLVIGVEAAAGELDERAPALDFQGTPYRLWREVENFASFDGDGFVYVTDRNAGTITFAPAIYTPDDDGVMSSVPASLGEVPPAGRIIRAWYRSGGGAEGNVAAERLKALKDPIPGLQVTNPAPATGGRDAETLDNALLRGPKELHSLQRAVTADDFELVALKTNEVARAKAVTLAELWSHAPRGTVEVLLVPDVPEAAWQGDWLPAATLIQYATEEARDQVQNALDERRPLGTNCRVSWAHYTTVRVTGTVVVRKEENLAAVRDRVHKRLHRAINPLPSAKLNTSGWSFGQALRASDVYDAALSEPGVRYIEDVTLHVDSVPNAVTTLAADVFQPRTWYAGSESRVFRSLNDGDGWELTSMFPDEEQVELVRAHPRQAGFVAALTRIVDSESSRVYVSDDCGESWQSVVNTDFHIEDMTWTRRDRTPVLLLATDKGLYELADPLHNGNIIQVLVDRNNQALSFYSVTTVTGISGDVTIAVAAQNSGGVYLSMASGHGYRKIDGMEGLDVRELAVQYQGPRAWLWAGTFTFGDDPGKGVYRWEVRPDDEDPVTGWETFVAGWTGGSCRGLTFSGGSVLAASHRAGVMRLDPTKANAEWQPSDVNSGLPVRDLKKGRLVTIDTIAANPAGALIMAGIAGNEDQASGKGVYRAADQGDDFKAWKFERCTTTEFADKVTLPETWLFASGAHDITVVSENEAR